MKALRGAITVEANTKTAIVEATRALLAALADRNNLKVDDIVSVFFTLTPDLNACFPAAAARSMGWDVPLLDLQEADVSGALPRCIRVLIHAEIPGPIQHAYLRDAVQLRPDLDMTGGDA